jgi:cell division protein FtsI (penicillin-binding protein 3)
LVFAAAPARAATTTSNHELQSVVTSELQRTIETWHADGGAILVLTPKGEVLAEAGEPDRMIVAGSTMKPLLLAAALEEGVVQESDVFESAPVGELLAKSSNPGFARIFERVGSEKLGRVLQGFHFTLPATLDANAAIGGTMPATPRQVAQAYAALANGGNGVVSPRTASRVAALMEGVVTSKEGTGKKARVEGLQIAGKTGTSEWTADGKQHGYASFVGIVPGRFVIYVGVESARGAHPWGGEVAAPVFARIAAVRPTY